MKINSILNHLPRKTGESITGIEDHKLKILLDN